MTFQLSPLPYAYDSLEPYIDKQTMIIHHDKHHQIYTDRLNETLKNYPELQEKSADELLKNLKKIPEAIRQAVINNGGGYVNHNFFWEILKKNTKIKGEIKKEITKEFDSYDKFKEKFTKAAISLFGNGWIWLVLNKNKELEIIQTKNQDSPLSLEKIPLVCIDLWEHAYYLKYQNRRAEYIEAFFNVINWNKVNELFLEVRSE